MLQLWDIGGQPRFRSMWERYCRGVSAIVWVYPPNTLVMSCVRYRSPVSLQVHGGCGGSGEDRGVEERAAQPVRQTAAAGNPSESPERFGSCVVDVLVFTWSWTCPSARRFWFWAISEIFPELWTRRSSSRECEFISEDFFTPPSCDQIRSHLCKM